MRAALPTLSRLTVTVYSIPFHPICSRSIFPLTALDDEDDKVWKHALDGFVTLAANPNWFDFAPVCRSQIPDTVGSKWHSQVRSWTYFGSR